MVHSMLYGVKNLTAAQDGEGQGEQKRVGQTSDRLEHADMLHQRLVPTSYGARTWR